jgi:hypothetical protein
MTAVIRRTIKASLERESTIEAENTGSDNSKLRAAAN